MVATLQTKKKRTHQDPLDDQFNSMKFVVVSVDERRFDFPIGCDHHICCPST